MKKTHPKLRFWKKVNKKGDFPKHNISIGRCWVWTASVMAGKEKYGYFSYFGKMRLAHRVSYALWVGVIPKDMKVCHRCDNPSCVRPSHLRLDTQLGNVQEAVTKDRHARGESHSRSKLTDLEVIQIRKIYKKGSHKFGAGALSKIYGVAAPTILNAANGQTWKHI